MEECTLSRNDAQIWSFGSFALDEATFELSHSDVLTGCFIRLSFQMSFGITIPNHGLTSRGHEGTVSKKGQRIVPLILQMQ